MGDNCGGILKTKDNLENHPPYTNTQTQAHTNTQTHAQQDVNSKGKHNM